MLVSRLRLATAAAVFAFTAGCSGAIDAPPSLVGTYLLHTAAGQPAPALIHTAVGNTLHFDSNYLQNIAFNGTVGAGRMLSVTQNLATEGTPDLYLFTPAP